MIFPDCSHFVDLLNQDGIRRIGTIKKSEDGNHLYYP